MLSSPIYRDPQGNRFTADRATGEWRPLEDSELGNAVPSRVLDQMGVDWDERFTLKNFSANPGTAEAFLKSLTNEDGTRKYEVFQYGDGLNFAVRRLGPDGTPIEQDFKVVDQNKGGIGEFFRDVTDLLVGDIALPTLGVIGGAFAGSAAGPAGTIAGVAAGSAAAEATRQGIGTAAGIPDNIDPVQTAVVGAVGGATQGLLAGSGALIGKFVRKGAKTVASGLRSGSGTQPAGILPRVGGEFSKRIAGLSEAEGLSANDILADAAVRFGHPAITPERTVNIAQQHMAQVAKPWISRLVAQRDALITKKMTVDLLEFERPLLKMADRILQEESIPFGSGLIDDKLKLVIKTYLQPPSRDMVQATMKPGSSPGAITAKLLGETNKWRLGLKKFPARDALRIKSRFQEFAADAGAFRSVGSEVQGAASVSPRLARQMSEFTTALNRSIKKAPGIPAAVREIDQEISAKIIARTEMLAGMGTDANNPLTWFTRALSGAGKPVRDVLKKYDSAYQGAGFFRLAREVIGALQLTPKVTSAAEFGVGASIPQIAARAGLPIGATAVGGGIVGGFTGGPVGMVAGGALGIGLASPRNIIRMTRPFSRATRAVRGEAERVAESFRPGDGGILRRGVAIPQATSAAGREFGKHIADEDKKKPRKAYFTAQ